MAEELTLGQYQKMVEEQGQELLDFLAHAATGNLDREIEVPSGIDVFTDLAIGLSYLIDDLRALVIKEREAQVTLEQRVADRTRELEEALTEVRAVQRRYVEREWSAYMENAIIGDETLPAPWAPAIETAVRHQQPALHTNGETALAVPVRYADEVLGVLGFGGELEINWGTDEITAVETIVEQVGFALENQRLFDQTQAALAETEEQARRLALLNEMGAALSAVNQLEEIYRIAGEHALKIIGGDRASISLIDTSGEAFHMILLSGEQGPIPAGQRLPLAGTIMGEVHRLHRLLLLPNENASLEDFIEGRQFAQVGFQSAIVAPLFVGEQIIGTLNVGSRKNNAFGSNSANLMRQVTTLLTTTLENQRLFAETQTRAEQLAAINRLAQAIAQQLDRDQLLATVNEQIRRIMPADSFIVAFYEASTNEVSYPYINESGAVSQHPPMPLNPQSHMSAVISSRQPVLYHLTPEEVADVSLQNTSLHLGDTSKPSSASLIFAPLQIGSRVTGAISVQSYAHDAYTSADVTLLSGVANNVAVALENVRLFAETQQRAATLQTLAEIETALSLAQTEDDMLLALLNHLPQDDLVTAMLGYLRQDEDLSAEEMLLDLVSLWESGSFMPEEAARMQNIRLSDYAISTLWQEEAYRPTAVADVMTDSRSTPQLRQEAEAQGWRRTVHLPLRSGGRWQGLVALLWKAARPFSDDEMLLFDQLLEPVAAVIATRRAQLAQQEALTETEALYTAGAELNAAQTFDDVLTVLRRHTIAGQNAQNISLNYFDHAWTEKEPPTWIDVLARYSELPAEAVLARYPIAAFPAAHTVLRPDAPTALEDIATDPNLDEGSRKLYTQQFGAKSTIFVPMVIAGQWVGYINAIYQQTTHFTGKDLRRFMALAGQAAVAVQNIRLLQQTARKAQREQLLREITAQVRSSANVDTIMKTAVKEIGQALGRRTYIYLGDAPDESPSAAQTQQDGAQHEQR